MIATKLTSLSVFGLFLAFLLLTTVACGAQVTPTSSPVGAATVTPTAVPTPAPIFMGAPESKALPTPAPVSTVIPESPKTPTPTPIPAAAAEPTSPRVPTTLSLPDIEIVAGATQQLEAVVVDQFNNAVELAPVTWTLNEPRAGFLSQEGLFTANKLVGDVEDAIEARVGPLSARASISIIPGPLEQLVIAPNPVDIGMGMKQQFVAGGADQFGNRISGLTLTWNIESGGGSVSGSGTFTAGTEPGTYTNTVTVTATRGETTRSANATVTVEPDRIAFISGRKNDQFDIFIMNADGTGLRRLTRFDVGPTKLSWSPDGRRIAYAREGNIFILTDDGNWNITVVLSESLEASNLDWSPDGRKIVFEALSDESEEPEIYVVDIDGGNLTRLTKNSFLDGSPSWSPDGSEIAFVSYPGSPDQDGIYVMNVDGFHQQITLAADDDFYLSPQWSPDGKALVFQGVSGFVVARLGYAGWGLFKVSLKTGRLQILPKGNAPSWSHEGGIIFHSFQDASPKFLESGDPEERLKGAEIYVMSRVGATTRLTNNETFDGIPAWAPRKSGLEVSEDSIIIPSANTLEAMTVQEIIANVSDMVVRIETDQGSGSGFVIESDGLVLTNNHVVKDAGDITVFLNDGTSYTGEIRGRDLIRDLALIKIDAKSLPVLELVDVGQVSLGSEVIVVGYPLGISSLSVTRGLASTFRVDPGRNITWVQTDSAINPGNSGGPLVNLEGKVIGIITAKLVGANIEGVGFAISANTVKQYLARLKNGEIIAK